MHESTGKDTSLKSLEDFQREHGGGERYVLDPDQLSEREKLVNRCKERCLYLIEHSEKSESRLREKLRKSGKYTEDIIDEAMKMLKSYGYIDDRRFAEQLIKTYAGQKSLREIEQKLYQRGVGQAEIRAAMDAFRADDTRAGDAELAAVQRAIRKKCRDTEALGVEEKRKLYAALLRKGFSYELVTRALALDTEDSL